MGVGEGGDEGGEGKGVRGGEGGEERDGVREEVEGGGVEGEELGGGVEGEEEEAGFEKVSVGLLGFKEGWEWMTKKCICQRCCYCC